MARQMIVCSRFERHVRVDAPWHVGALELSGRAECEPWPLAWPGRYFCCIASSGTCVWHVPRDAHSQNAHSQNMLAAFACHLRNRSVRKRMSVIITVIVMVVAVVIVSITTTNATTTTTIVSIWSPHPVQTRLRRRSRSRPSLPLARRVAVT